MRKLILLLIMLQIMFVAAMADVTTTSQNLDDLSFKKGLKVNGGLSFTNNFYKGSDSLVLRDPYAFYLNGNLNVNLWGVSMPFSFMYSNTQKSYTQPFNRFKLDPRYKWVHLLIGTNVLEMSKYTLSDHLFTGVGVELTPGNWNISGMYGRLKKAIEYDPKIENFNTVSYKRMGYAAKVAYTWNYGEYKVTFFHGEDDKNSLDYYVPDDILLTPQKNTAASASFSQKFLKYFYVNGEYAFSLFNTNIYNEEYEAVETNNFINKLFGKHSSNKYVDAISAAVGYQGPIFGVALQYERVSPFYYTLGGYYFTNDTENFTIAPNLKLFKGKLNFSGNFGLQYNNLNNDKMNDTRQMVYSANASFNSGGAWVASASFSNFTTYTKIRPTSYPYYTDDLDSLNFYQISRNVTAMTAYNFGSESLKNSISLTGSYQCANMLSEDKLTSYSDFFSSNISFNQQFVPQTLSWSFYANANYVNASVAETVYFGPGVSLNKAFLKNTLSTSISCAYNVNNVSGKNTGSLLNSGLSASYTIKGIDKKFGNHTFSLNSGYTLFFGEMESANNEYQFLTTLTYRVNF